MEQKVKKTINEMIEDRKYEIKPINKESSEPITSIQNNPVIIVMTPIIL